MLDFPPGADIPQNDRSMQAHVRASGPYAFNIFCMTALENDRYPYGEGQVWADADVDHAAELMRNFVARREKKPEPAAWPESSAATVGKRYRRRLKAICRERSSA